jgi:hypothetical protein
LSRLTIVELLVAVLLTGSMWFYVDHILVPHQRQHAAEHDIPRGTLSDLYPRWLGSRELLLHGRDPYSAEITQEIQAGYYGRPLDPTRPTDPKDEERFAYPVYVAFLLAPTVKLTFPAVQAVFSILLTALTILIIPVWVRILDCRWPRATTAALVILTLGSFGVVQGIKLQQLTLLIAAFMTTGVAALVWGHPMTAGVFIALSTIKPQLALPLAGWLILWSLGNPRERWKYLGGFLISMAALMAASEYLLPGWVARFADAIIQYRRYTGGGGSVLEVLLSPAAGRVVALLIVAVAAIFGWRNRYHDSGSENFRQTTALVLAATVVSVPMTAPYNQILLVPAILLILRSMRTLWDASRGYRWLLTVLAGIVLEPYLAAFALAIIAPFTPQQTLFRLWAAPLYTSLAVPVVVLATLLVSFREASFVNRRKPSPANPA